MACGFRSFQLVCAKNRPSLSNYNRGKVFRATETRGGATSYGYNVAGAGVGQGGFGLGGAGTFINDHLTPTLGGYERQTPESAVLAPADMLAIGDGYAATQNGGLQESILLSRNAGDSRLTNRFAFFRHRGSLNDLFCDGHVENNKVFRLYSDGSEEWTRKWYSDHAPHANRQE
jgi:prepilin-type processing-associated H-X9-DG protein